MKKHITGVLALLLLLAGCSANAGHCPVIDTTGPWESDPAYIAAMAQEDSAHIYVPDRELTAYEVVEAYFEQHYLTYSTNTYIDVSSIVDMDQGLNRNLATWTRMLTQRRRLIAGHDLAYVETERFPYEIAFEDEVEDERMAYWESRGQSPGEDEMVLHFDITGIEGQAYPPVLAVNTRHTMRLKQVDGAWKVTFHYFPGAVRKFYWTRALNEVSDQVALARLMDEFAAPLEEAGLLPVPAGAVGYDGEAAAQYALAYTEKANPLFYHIGDWMGNCANFTSQSVWYGFSADREPDVSAMDNMTASWFAGAGGGSPAWENVGYFWDYIMGGGSLRGQQLASVSELELGDVIQTRTYNNADEAGYSHSLMVVDKDTLMLAQNSPGCFVYYSDVFNVDTRIVRPAYLLS